MIAEDLLERGLAAAGDGYEVPAGAVDRLRAQLEPAVPDETAERRGLHRMSRRGWVGVAAAAAVVLVALPFVVGGTSNPDTKVLPAAGAPAAVSNGAEAGGAAVGAPTLPSISAGGSVDSGKFAAAPTRDATNIRGAAGRVGPGATAKDRVVKTGSADLQVPKGAVHQTLQAVTDLAGTEHGFVASSSSNESGANPSGDVTLRVPVGRFEDAVNQVHAIGTAAGNKVLSLQTSGQDVTARYVDLQAQIKALSATRRQFLTLLSRARTIGETLAVETRIGDVQTQIDQLKGERNVLASRSAMSTLTVSVDQRFIAPPAPKAHHESGISRAFHRSVSRFVHGVESIVAGIGPVLLAALILLALWFAGRLGYRVLRRRLV